VERVIGIEPTFTAWEAVVLPLDDTRGAAPSGARHANSNRGNRTMPPTRRRAPDHGAGTLATRPVITFPATSSSTVGCQILSGGTDSARSTSRESMPSATAPG
jgi:hypothetical protein